MRQSLAILTAGLLLAACTSPPKFDIVIHGGTIYDGSGEKPFTGSVAIRSDTIAVVWRSDGERQGLRGRVEIDATGLAVAPGFVNMLSWATESWAP
jgi:N-acyl-D-amino-acid deacylase